MIIAKLPDLEDLVLDGRSCQEVFSQKDDDNLENLLLIAERVALENRLDLMNARAQLYDTWRQIRFTANALKGIFNVAVTNQFVTPPTTNNPFGFVDQAKQFSLVLNAELPLVRVAERNNFRTALINYQRQRRTLQNAEDFAQATAPPGDPPAADHLSDVPDRRAESRPQHPAEGPGPRADHRPAAWRKRRREPGGLADDQPDRVPDSVLNNENQLVTQWYQYQSYRLQIYRDLGILPYDEWEAFDEIFPPDRTGAGSAAAVDREGRPAVARANVAPGVADPCPAPLRRPAWS